ncbi:DUF803-domain-containing protein [Lepidopterella palustris CBS 459.81]|uniref:DUF803-domain-containing protein n=1 Tax=Lepidopterella palustris CBS 459.81 TaxID=1314670 RepID=A0A8E2JEG5_9PEZI|nr:DUF803-domain-containing protein [Lepidopterella palustris CBS 459.81]
MVTTDDIIIASQIIYVRSGATPSSGRPPIYKVVGLILAISSGLFIGVSFVLKKTGLLKANVKYNEEAGEGYGYLKNAFWWTGMTLMIIGEICNFVAYAFVDAILVTPLGALSVVVTTILSAIFLKERLSFVGKVGCFNCIVGSVVIVINAPSQSAVSDIQDMKKLVIAPGFLSYAGVVIVASVFTALWAGPRYGKKSMMVYLSICSLIGGLSVVATQGLGAAIVAQISGKPQFNQWFIYVLLVFVISTLVTEIIYLNKALNIFNAALVTPTYYVFFTSSTIVTSAVLFQGFKGTAATISTVIMGFLQICAGVVLLQLSKSSKDVPDAAVFSGDLDQVRTVAEQEEPEYEPRADTIRGGGALLRSFSIARQEKQALEARRLQEERMQPIGENEQVEWDGLRRRTTIIEPGRLSTLQRRKTIHPPLGMSHFPSENEAASDDEDIHPGFFNRLRSRRSRAIHSPISPVPLSGLRFPKDEDAPPRSADIVDPHSHVYGLPRGLQDDFQEEDTSYKPHEPAIHWASGVEDERVKSKDSLAPPKPPPHTAKRQFSFQNVFHRNRSESTGEGGSGSGRPMSRGALSFSSRKESKEHNPHGDGTTEEERLGLVKGDSQNMLAIPDYGNAPPEYSDTEEDWQMASRGTSPHVTLSGGSRLATVPSETSLPQFAFEPRKSEQKRDDDTDDDDRSGDSHGKDFEKSGRGSPGAFM